MKLKQLVFYAFLLIPLILPAQNKVDFGLFLGYAEHGGDVHSWGRHGAMITQNASLAYGINLKYNVNQNIGIRLNGFASSISGEDINLDLPGHDKRNYSFDSPIYELSLVGEYDILGHKRWRERDTESEIKNAVATSTNKTFKRIISPYVFGGFGLSFTDPDVQWNGDNNKPSVQADIENTTKTNFQIPLGIGVKFDISEKVYLSLEGSARIPLTDYLDGISESADPEDNDAYQFFGLNLGVRLGKCKDMDADGVCDSKDQCPQIPGKEMFQGCPDSDEDGIMDSEDSCPNLAGIAQYNGCPDTDGDGIIDPDDDCPEVPGEQTYQGCPDTDGDGIPDNKDECPADVGTTDNNGCPIKDSDGDGYADDVDNCPDTPGSMNGCPDSDGDGYNDLSDPCPEIAGTLGGCPDTDGDGVADNLDKCPTVSGSKQNNGCPAQKTRSRAEIINGFSIDDIYFDTNKSEIKDLYVYRINEIVAFADQYPEAKFDIIGHTDNRNSDAYNQGLSERRAKRVYEALLKKGLDKNRLFYKAVGETSPKAENASEEGKAKNRRVEVRARL